MAVAIPTLKELFEAGAHFGHKKEHSYPSSREFVFTQKEGILVIDLEKTQKGLESALKFMQELVKENKKILFVSTKKQIQEKISQIAKEAKMPYINYKWFGGTLTNFETILKTIKKMKKLDEHLESEEFKNLTKRERIKFKEQLEKMHHNFDGLVEMDKMPEALFVVDPAHEKVAVSEAKKLAIPVVAICDTNADTNLIDYPIPANDDSIEALNLILDTIGETMKQSLPKIKVEKEKKK